MWKLTIEDDEGKQTSLPLAHEEYGLGRADSNAIRLTDRNVSRNHALIKKNGQGWFLKDLQSYNGTYVNGNRVVADQPVASGDVVQLGDYRLELLDETTVAAAEPNAPAAAAPIHQRPNRLVLVVGPTPGQEFPLDRDHFTIGRSEEATISINHSSVSRIHAEVIAIGSGRFEIVDKGSANGIRINGVELRRGILEAGDALELGDVRLRFVGAGKIYKAFADQTAQVHPVVAMPGFDSVSSVRPPGRSGNGPSVAKLVGIGALVGVIAIIIFVVVTRASGAPPAQQPATTGQGAAPAPVDATLAAAQALADKKDLDGAHAKLASIADGSPSRDAKAFKDIENAWADATFAKVEAASDKGAKQTLLRAVSRSTTVDPERRKKAYGLLQEIDAAEPPPPEPPPPRAAANPAPQGGGVGVGAAPSPRVASNPEPKGAAPAKVDAPAPPPVDGLASEQKQADGLMGKVFAGKGSEQEIRMLKALCAHLGNRDCRDRASAMLKKKQDEAAH